MKLSGWGRFPQIESNTIPLHFSHQVANYLTLHPQQALITHGLGRSYGDSALADTTLQTRNLDQFIHFDPQTGVLCCASGMSLAQILHTFVPQGWFLPVTPGTQFVTIGGAIASDVHGKNHHVDGSFSHHVLNLTLCLASGEVVTCSHNENRELFLATCGGMGLTGIILSATIQLIRIETAFIDETTWKCQNLEETLEQFETHADTTYSVAWIDCLTKGKQLGRSLLMLGEHATAEQCKDSLARTSKKALNIPFNMPSMLLNSLSVKAFNTLYYHKTRQQQSQRFGHYLPYFYPLDAIHNWNRLYGKQGFTQYQFVIPKSAGLEALSTILNRIVDSKRGSFLAVLKAFGKGNDNYLSFPMEGYTLAVDFKIDNTLFSFLDELDRVVLDYGGRLYLAKDARMSEEMFKSSYPQWEQFQTIREQYGAIERFQSLQSQRLGLSSQP